MSAKPPRSRQDGGATNRVVVVDGSEEICRLRVERLASRGYEAITAVSIQMAIALLRARAVDTIVINLSAFSSATLSHLAQIMHLHRDVDLIATVSVVAAPGRARRRRPSQWRRATYCFRFSSPEQLDEGLNGHAMN
jgi:response regulator RpfG family c-di-GMP phosphodiesterase